eukprot:5589220-Alexandrium_andersonii.AAC.1
METLEAIAAVRDIDATFRRRDEREWRGNVECKLFCACRWMLSKAPIWARAQVPSPEFHQGDQDSSIWDGGLQAQQ